MFFVFFPGGSSDVPAQYDTDLKEAACHTVLGAVIKIRGYADRTGDLDNNQRLSEQRAVNVLNRMSSHGAPCDLLRDYKGMGEENAPGQREDRPFSRRVEISAEGTLPTAEAVLTCMARSPPNPSLPQCVKPR
jgi:outer membrane protein OmpA-like peptidoglycan-associated protein